MTQLFRAFGELLPLGVLLGLGFGFLVVAWGRISERYRTVLWIVAASLWVVSVGLITLSRSGPVMDEQGQLRHRAVVLRPLSETIDMIHHATDPTGPIAQLGGNIAMFIPLGVLLAIRYRASLLAITALGMATGTIVETAQWIIGNGRVSSVDDILLAAIGTFLGALAGHLVPGKASTRGVQQAPEAISPGVTR